MHSAHVTRRMQARSFAESHARHGGERRKPHSQRHITFRDSKDENRLHPSALLVLDSLITKAGIAHVEITSTVRNEREQVDAMFPKLKCGKIDSYGPGGKAVQSVGLMLLHPSAIPGFPSPSEGQIKQAMLDTVKQVGLSHVTPHAPSSDHDTFDVSWKGLTPKECKAFVTEAKHLLALGTISSFGWPEGPKKGEQGYGRLFHDNDCLHLVVPRPKERTDSPSRVTGGSLA